MKNIKIVDTTLRDGEQTPRVNLNTNEKLRIAKQLEHLGVDVIEAGFAIASPGDFEAVSLIAKEIKKSTVSSLSRLVKKDIDASVRALKEGTKTRIHVFIATSPIHRKFKLKMSKEEIINSIQENVAYARKFVDEVEFSCEDGTRTEKEFLVEAYSTAIEAGATILNVPDTVGYRTPEEMYSLISYLKSNIRNIEKAEISVHCHNDLGLSVANSIASIKGGATQIECTINGLGERAGNTSLEEVVMIINTRTDIFKEYQTNINTKQLYPTSKLVGLLTGVEPQPNKAIVGANAFSHESGIHQHGVLENPETYEIMKPDTVGRTSDSLILGKLSGKHAFIDKLNTLGIHNLSEDKVSQLFDAFKKLADKKKYILDDDIIALIAGDAGISTNGKFKLKHFEIYRDNNKTKAKVEILENGNLKTGEAYGDGPVDAAFQVINKIFGSEPFLSEYKLDAITEDVDAQAQATVIILNKEKEYIGRGQSTDIVEASIKAYINAINRVCSLGKTLFDKIWDNHVIIGKTGEAQLLYIDLHLLHEVTSPQAFSGLKLKNRTVRKPELCFATMDHNTPTTVEERKCIKDPFSQAQLDALENNCKEFGVELAHMNDERNGIVHTVGPEQGLTQPGKTIVCGDSHTATHGAFGAIAFGIGTSEVEHVLATQTLWQKKPKTMGVKITGNLPKGVYAKDIILHFIKTYGVAVGNGYAFEFFGDTIENLDMESRLTICNMAIEAGGKSGIIAPDEKTFEYLKGRPYAPNEEEWENMLSKWKMLKTDSPEAFDKIINLDVSNLEPQITWGTSPEMGMNITDTFPIIKDINDKKAYEYMGLTPGASPESIPLKHVFIGSCTNGRLSDLKIAASYIKGRKINPNISGIVVPGSQIIKKQAEELGIDKIFKDAGFQWRESGCSSCLGMNPDLIPYGEHCASTSNRNFEGRQGNGARTHLISPAMAVLAAIYGHFIDARFEIEEV
ncbi:2-isopropylmalate synthase [Fusobacterium sp. IOR10]|uniref:2-isopropylmalate synthase n=1 Tax=Fusobacterium sp. IOR10 TaxID=2665157 RepID=UPI00193F7656